MMLLTHAIFFVFLTFVAVCSQSCDTETYSAVTWPDTNAGEVAAAPCPSEEGNAYRICSDKSTWMPEVDTTNCSSKQLEALRIEASESSWEVTTDFLINLTGLLKDGYTTSGEHLVTVNLISQSLSCKDFFSNSSTVGDLLEHVFKAADLLLNRNTCKWWLNIHQFENRERCLEFLNELQAFGERVTSFLSGLEQEDVTALEYTHFISLQAIYKIQKDGVGDINATILDTSATIPSAALESPDAFNNFGIALLQFNNSVGQLLPDSSVLPRNNVSTDDIYSAFVSVSVFPIQPQNTFYTVTLPYKTNNELSCSSMNVTNVLSLWHIDSCSLISLANNMVTCNCIGPGVYVAVTVPPPRSMPTAVFAALVVTEILIWTTIIMLLCANRRLESDRAIVVKLFLVTVSATHITLLCGLYVTENEGACTAVALLLHFFELSEAFWLLGMAVQLVLKVTYKTTDSGSTAQFMALGWITPLFVVASSAGLNVQNYGTTLYCFLNVGQQIFYAFAVPAGLIIVTAFICLLHIAYTYFTTKKSNRKIHRRLRIIFPNIRATLVGCITLSLDWTMTVLELLFYTPVTNAFLALLKVTEALCFFLLYGIFSSEVQIEYEKRYGPCWPNRRKKGEEDSPRPGTNDELSQIRESSVIHDLDSSISVAGPLAAYARASSAAASNGGYGYSNSTTSLRKNDMFAGGSANGGGTLNPFIVKGNETITEKNGGSSATVHTDSGASTSSLRADGAKRGSALPATETKHSFKGLNLKHKLKVFPLMKHDQLREEPST